MVPLLVVTGESGSGKTTLIAGIVEFLSRRGYRVGVLKHSPHHPGLEVEGKDTWKFSRAGAAVTCLAAEGFHFVTSDSLPAGPEDLMYYFGGLDLVLAEGYKHGRREDTPVLEILKEGQTRRYSKNPLALVYRRPPDAPLQGTPWFLRDDIAGLSAFIEEQIQLKEEGPDV